MEEILLLGFGGHAKSVVDSIEQQGIYHIAGFLEVPGNETARYKEYKVIGCDDDAKKWYDQGIRHAFITVGYLGNSRIRNKLYTMLKEIGFHIPIVTDPDASLAQDVILGEGTFVGKQAVVNSGAQVGTMCIINSGAIVEHDCFVGEYSHIAAGAVLCGAVQVGTEVLVGANATVIQERQIGNRAIVGAGCTVLRNIEDSETYYGKK